MKESLRFSIITPSYNQGQYIEDTIKSVLDQNYNNFEHIVIDGGSTDNTIEILKRYSHLEWISEKDKGQSDAINKGIKRATGDIIAWLNSDDYYEKNIFEKIENFFNSVPDAFFLYGDITYIDKNKNFIEKIQGDTISYEKLLNDPDIVRQPSSFWRSEVHKQIGLLDDKLQLVMDYEFFLRVGKNYKFYYYPENFSYFRSYNEGKTSYLKRKQAKELFRVMKGYSPFLKFSNYKFLFGRYVDSFSERNLFKRMMSTLRKGQSN